MAELNGAVRLGDVLRLGEFRWLLLALLQSQIGNQVARVALAVAVFERTGSATATSAIFALTFIPAVLGGVVLAPAADRFARRDVMIAFDLLRAVLFAAMAAVPLPISVMYVLVGTAAFLGPPFASAQMALLPEIVGVDRFPTAAGLVRSGDQLASLTGYAIGGVVVAVLGARPALGIDAASFGLSAVLLGLLVARHSVVLAPIAGGRRTVGIRAVARLVFGDRKLRLLIGLASTVSFYVAPEALAAPYAAQLGRGAVATGLLMASIAIGVALGNVLLLRLVSPQRRERMLGVLAVTAALPLIACLEAPPLVISLLLWFICGLLCSFVVVATATYSITVDNGIRGAAIGIASSCLLGSQGAVSLLVGAIASLSSPSVSIAVSAAAGLAISGLLAINWQARRRVCTAERIPSGSVQGPT